MDNQRSIFRKKSMERISSPEQMDDYLRATNPAVWIVLAAVALLLSGLLIWGAFTYIGSSVEGRAQVRDGGLIFTADDPALADNIEVGMHITVGDTSCKVAGIGYTDDGEPFALAETELADGSYPAHIQYKKTQVLQLLFSGKDGSR